MTFVVTAVTMPPKSHLPFWTGTKQPNNTLQSLALMTFCCFCLVDAIEWSYTLFQSGAQGIAESLFNPAFFATLGTETSPALDTVAQFFVIDRLTMAVSIFFAWYYLKESHHRVSQIFELETCCLSFVMHILTTFLFLSDNFVPSCGKQNDGCVFPAASLGG